jgi:hypothetical protein
MRFPKVPAPALLLAVLSLGLAVFAAPAHASLIKNPDMESDTNGDGWPDNWPKLKSGGTWENEAGNHFIRMTATEPNKTTMLYMEIHVPAGAKELELSWRWRVSNLVVGSQSWFDARFMMEWMDAGRGKVSGSPKAPSTRSNTDGWVQRSMRITVPEGARILKFMPSLFQVQSGTLDIDDVVLRQVAP